MATDKKKTAQSSSGRELFIVATSAATPDGPVSAGQIAEAGSKILGKYPALFRPLTITYEA